MKLPLQVSIRLRAHGHGHRGMAFYEYEDAEGLGIVMDARRENGRAPFIESWRFRWMPGQAFSSFKELVDALAAYSEEAVAAERARWPVLLSLTARDADPPTGSCWLHNDRPAAFTAYAQTCWLASSGEHAILCAECGEAARRDAMVVVIASAKRVADVAARKTNPPQESPP